MADTATNHTWAGDAMDTLKMKIFLLKKENSEEAIKLAAAEKEKAEADERITAAEKKIKELSKQIHARKLLLDENTDKLSRNTVLANRKEEATLAAKEEIKTSTAREMQLKAEVERVMSALPSTQSMLCIASEKADNMLSEVKKLEIHAMLTDQTIEEMEQQLAEAHNVSSTTLNKAEEMGKKLTVRSVELARAEDRATSASNRLENVNQNLKVADRKMAGLQYSLEERMMKEKKYKKQVMVLHDQLNNAQLRSVRDEEALLGLRKRMEVIDLRRKAREEKQRQKK